MAELPLHRLNTPQTKLWLLGGPIQREMATALAKHYKFGCFLLSATLRHIVNITPRAQVVELPPPHRQYKMHEIANRPAISECQCAAFYDPQSLGAWGERHDPAGKYMHHPFCQFERTAERGFKGHFQRAGPSARPDDWHQQREELNDRGRIQSK